MRCIFITLCLVGQLKRGKYQRLERLDYYNNSRKQVGGVGSVSMESLTLINTGAFKQHVIRGNVKNGVKSLAVP